jgi:peptidylprolyl isomerase
MSKKFKERLVLHIPMKIMILAAIALILSLAACSSGSDSDSSDTSSPGEATTESSQSSESPPVATAEIEEPAGQDGVAESGDSALSSDSSFDAYAGASEEDVITTASGLEYVILEEGNGAIPENGQIVSVHYTGWLLDGSKFDSSVDRDTPFQFPLGQGRVIGGWDEGIALLNEGSKARLIIPSDLGYGEFGSGSIPPGASLVFEVELLEILPGSPNDPMEVSENQFVVAESGLKYFDIEEGEGAAPEEGQVVFLHFTGWLEDGTKLGSTIESGQPIPYQLGSGELFPGFEEGISSMKLGGIRQMVFPPELAYGEAGTAGGQVPPDATIIFEVEVLGIQ